MEKKKRRSHEYFIWAQMKQRCLNKKHPKYKVYGAKGIKICPEWMDYDGFLSDMGYRPSEKHSIDRIDPEGNYEPSNCRWATTLEQGRNKIKYAGRTDFPKRKFFASRINPKLLKQFISACRTKGISIQDALEFMLDKAVKDPSIFKNNDK